METKNLEKLLQVEKAEPKQWDANSIRDKVEPNMWYSPEWSEIQPFASGSYYRNMRQVKKGHYPA